MEQQNNPFGAGGDTSSAMLELQVLERDVENVLDLAGLKVLFYRLEAISQQAPNDSAVQAAVSQVKQKILTRGMELKQAGGATSSPTPASGAAAPPQTPYPGTPTSQSYAYGAPPPYTAAPTPPPDLMPASFAPGVESTAGAPSTAGYGAPPPAPPQTPPPPPVGAAWKRALILGGIIGVVAFTGLVFTLRKTVQKPAEPTAAALEVQTSPPGAQIRINDEARCKSNCKVELAPGSYVVQALLDGFEPASTTVNITPGAPASVNLTLQPSPLQVKLFADLESGQVTLDEQPAGELQQGQFVLEKVTPGKHTVKVSGKGGEATFSFEVNPGQAPAVSGPIAVKNFLAILVAGAGNAARLHTSVVPLKIALDGQPAGEASADGLPLQNLTTGDHELTVGEGKDQRKLVVGFSPAPMLTAFLKLDLNAGTLVVNAGEQGAGVLLNGKLYRGPKTGRGGQLRIPALPVGLYAVRVVKEGFQDVAEQKVQIRKGEETPVEFKMVAVPKMAALRLKGAIPGAQVMVDGASLGLVYTDGTFQAANISPGERTVELKRERYTGKQVRKEFRAGETLEISGSEFAMEILPGTLHLNVTPATARVMIRRSDETQPRQVKESILKVPEGTYTITASSPNFLDYVVTVQVLAGETKTIPMTLTPLRAGGAVKQAPAVAGGMADWDEPGAWVQDGPWLVRRGGNYVTYRLQPVQGVFEFKVGRLRGSRLQWFVNYRDQRNYSLFELEKKTFSRKDVINGRTIDLARKAEPRLESESEYRLRIEIGETSVVHKVFRGGNWEVLDSWQEPGRNFTAGKFGFRIGGRDQVGLADFSFRPN